MNYYITTFPGIEDIAKRELIDKWFDIKIDNTLKAKNNSLVFFDFEGDAQELFRIGTAEDLYVPLASLDLCGQRQDLDKIKGALLGSSNFELALSLHRQLNQFKDKKKRTTFRVVAQATGRQKDYRRVDAQKATEKAILERYNKKWELVDDDAQLEVWLHLIHNKAVLGLRLSDRTMRHRDYKIENLPASLRPTIAFALVFLSKIEDGDIFMDPMCGAGTILIERGRTGRYKQLLGGDIMPEAVEIAKKNIGNKYKPISVQVWDATKLPLEDMSVNKIVTNLPFGKQIGSHEENKVLYKNFIKELTRILKVGGRSVLLTSEYKLLQDAISKNKKLKLVEHYKNISVLGYKADIFVLDKLV